MPEVWYELSALCFVNEAKAREPDVRMHMDMKHRRVVLIGELQGFAHCSGIYRGACSRMIKVVFIFHGMITVREHNETGGHQRTNPASQKAHSFCCEWMWPEQIFPDFPQQLLRHLESNSHWSALMCSASISAGRSCELTPFQDHVCHVRSSIRWTLQLFPRPKTRSDRNSLVA